MKKILSVLLSLGITFSSFTTVGFAAEQKDIVIIYTNDTHCEISGELGFADISAIEAIETAKGNEVIIVDAGDAVQGGTVGAISKGEYIIEIMNEVGYDAAALGNHEFDYQIPRLGELAETANFPYISANFVWANDNTPVFEPYYMTTAGGVDIAFVAATTPHTIVSTAPDYFKDEKGEFLYDFSGENFYDLMQETVDEVTEKGADVVIAVTHLGVSDADLPYTSKELISNTSGIDAVIDAHSHSVVDGEVCKNESGEDILLTSTGSKFQNIGIMRVSGEEITAELVGMDYKKDGIPTDGQAAFDKTNDFIENIKKEYEVELEKKVALSEFDLTVNNPEKFSEETGVFREVRRGETNLGDFVADAYRAVLGCDIAIINGGGVRANLDKGDVSYGDLLDVNPFGNELCVIEVTGKQILDALEHGAKSYPEEDGAFLQVSGLSYEIDENIPSSVVLDDKGLFKEVSGERRVKNVKVNGDAIDETAFYTFGGSNFTLLSSGDGFSMFQGAKLISDSVCTDLDALIKYSTEQLGGVIGKEYENPHGNGRIKLVAENGGARGALPADVSPSDWFYNAVKEAYARHLMTDISGYDVFAPNTSISRGMFVTVLYNAENRPAAPKLNFNDVESGMYYTEPVAWANANGIVSGISETEFAPNDFITREQIAVILFQYAKYKGLEAITLAEHLGAFLDYEEISEYALSALNWAVGAGVMSGKGDGILDPVGNATRAEAVAMLVNTIK